MGIHELTKENMKEIRCVCGEPAEVEILGYNDRQTVDMRVTCTKRSCAAHDRPYLMRNVHSASLIKDFIPEHKATCAECNWEGFSSQLYKRRDLSYICHSCLIKMFGKPVQCEECGASHPNRLMYRTRTYDGKKHYLCPRCHTKLYGSISCLTCENLDRAVVRCKRTNKRVTWDLRKPMNNCTLKECYNYGIVIVLAEDAGFPDEGGE